MRRPASPICAEHEITPNELFGVSGRMDDQFSQLGTWGMRTALKLQELLPAGRQAVAALLEALPGGEVERATVTFTSPRTPPFPPP